MALSIKRNERVNMHTEHQANEALQRAAQRIDWEGAHLDAWCAPAPRRQRSASHPTDYLLFAMLLGTVYAVAFNLI